MIIDEWFNIEERKKTYELASRTKDLKEIMRRKLNEIDIEFKTERDKVKENQEGGEEENEKREMTRKEAHGTNIKHRQRHKQYKLNTDNASKQKRKYTWT